MVVAHKVKDRTVTKGKKSDTINSITIPIWLITPVNLIRGEST